MFTVGNYRHTNYLGAMSEVLGLSKVPQKYKFTISHSKNVDSSFYIMAFFLIIGNK